MKYEYICAECEDTVIVTRKMSEPEQIPHCLKPLTVGIGDFHDSDTPITICAHGPMRRIYHVPQVFIQESGLDALNRHVRGEGDPTPGLSKEETQKAAIRLAANQRKNRGMKDDYLEPRRSYPGGGIHRYIPDP